MIGAALFPLLSAQSAVTELVGTRIYPVTLPSDPELPAITYQIVGMRANPTLNSTGMNRYRVQFDCWGASYAAADGLRAALVDSLDRYAGTVNGIQLQDVQLLQPIDYFDHELLQYRSTVEFYIFSNS